MHYLQFGNKLFGQNAYDLTNDFQNTAVSSWDLMVNIFNLNQGGIFDIR